MSIYSLSIRNISRGSGQSSTAKLSYITGQKVYDERTGEMKDARANHRKKDVVFVKTILPDNAPKEYADPALMFNRLEKNEKRSDAQIAKELIIALPRECTRDQQIRAVEEFIHEQFTSKDLPAVFAIHDSNDGNPHAHAIVSGRAIDKNGKWAVKEKKVCDLDENGNKIPVIDPKTGQQKVRVRKGKGTEKLWKMKTVSSDPLNGKENYKRIRKGWEQSVNRYLSEEHQVDSRSYKDRGLTIEPTQHEGFAARQMAARGEHVDVIENNRRILQEREEKQKLSAEIVLLGNQIEDQADKISSLYERMISKAHEAFASFRRTVSDTVEKISETISGFRLTEHFYNLMNNHYQDVAVFRYKDDHLAMYDVMNDSVESVNAVFDSDEEVLDFIRDEITGGYEADIMPEEDAKFYRSVFEESETQFTEDSDKHDGLQKDFRDPEHYERTIS